MRKTESKILPVAAPVIAVIILLIVWEAIARIFQIPEKLLPAPTAILGALADNFADVIVKDLGISAKNIALGYVLAVPIGFIVAALAAQFKLVVRAITPVLIILMVTPMATLVPIFQADDGAPIPRSKLSSSFCRWPRLWRLTALRALPIRQKNNVDVMKVMGCGRWRTFFKVNVPNAMPHVFTGLKLGCILGTIASMVADMTVGQGGLGYRIKIYASFASTASAFATILVAAVVGVALFQIVNVIERKVIVWK